MILLKKKKTAVIGAGWFGRAHVRNFYELSDLRAVCDGDEAKLNLIKQQYEGLNTYSNIDNLLKNEV
ncbi:unnamed protein product [marine sediment metagenome]|uniref:Gfo/Idh/MocA-like oxidoreductase N-terminal domain-containing protein n=1 Tax=marine sediment metagenome TaxID=412755 RepID=X1JFV3_9ZZZZ